MSLFSSMAAADIRYTVTDLGIFGGNYYTPRCVAINDNGDIVFPKSFSTSVDCRAVAYINSTDTVVDLGTVFPEQIVVWVTTNNNLDIWGTSNSRASGWATRSALITTPDHGMTWSAWGGDIGTLGGSSTQISAINDNGVAVGWSHNSTSNQKAISYSGGVMTTLLPKPTPFSGQPNYDGYAYAINNAGAIVGEFSAPAGAVPAGRHAFLQVGNTITDLTPTAVVGQASDINEKGQIVYFSLASNGQPWRAYLYDNGTSTDLGIIGSYGCKPRAVNNDGVVVGDIVTINWNGGFLYADGVMQDISTHIDSALWAVQVLSDVNNSGVIVGVAKSSADGKIHAIRLTKIPVNTAKDILTFVFPGLPDTIISGTDISVTVPVTTDLTALAPTYTVSPFATGSPASGTVRDFTSAQTYAVTAGAGGPPQVYTVTVTKGTVPGIFNWATAVTGNWSDSSKWTNNLATGSKPIAAGQPYYTLNFTQAGEYTATNDLSDGFVLNQLNFGGAVTLAGTNRLALTANDTTLPQINQNSSSGVSIHTPLTLAANTTFGGIGGGSLNLNGEITGPGGFTYHGDTPNHSVLTLSVSNSYAGPTIITGGTLQCNVPDALGNGGMSISNGAQVNLNYTGTKAIASLTLGGVAQTAPGTYGSDASAATFPNDTYFVGTGTVTVAGGAVSDYDTWAGPTGYNLSGGPTGDDDGDGMTNQQEYAFGLDPTLGSSVSPIIWQLDQATGNFQYTRRATPDATKLTYTVLTSTNQVDWATGGAAETGFTTVGAIQTVTVHVTAVPVDGKLFVRVEAASTP